MRFLRVWFCKRNSGTKVASCAHAQKKAWFIHLLCMNNCDKTLVCLMNVIVVSIHVHMWNACCSAEWMTFTWSWCGKKGRCSGSHWSVSPWYLCWLWWCFLGYPWLVVHRTFGYRVFESYQSWMDPSKFMIIFLYYHTKHFKLMCFQNMGVRFMAVRGWSKEWRVQDRSGIDSGNMCHKVATMTCCGLFILFILLALCFLGVHYPTPK